MPSLQGPVYSNIFLSDPYQPHHQHPAARAPVYLAIRYQYGYRRYLWGASCGLQGDLHPALPKNEILLGLISSSVTTRTGGQKLTKRLEQVPNALHQGLPALCLRKKDFDRLGFSVVGFRFLGGGVGRFCLTGSTLRGLERKRKKVIETGRWREADF